MAFIGEGSTTTPTSTQTTIPQTAPDYWKKMQEELKKQQALQAAQQANSWWYQLTQVPANQAQITNLPGSAFAANAINYLIGSQAPSGVSQAIGNTGYANWNPQSQYPAFAPMGARPDYQNPADTYAKRQAAYNQYLKNIYGYSDRYNDPFISSEIKKEEINPNFWINAYTDTNTDDYGLPAMSTETPPPPDPGNGYVEPEYPAWNFGGGGGGGRRSSSSVGRSKQLASWYQAMTNWNINRPQSG